jgi:DNA modification methylase
VFDFTRVVGNSKQRRSWHPTQLNEGLVERCVKFTTPERETILDPFGGTGTTLRVCRPLGYPCTLIEIDKGYRNVRRLRCVECRGSGKGTKEACRQAYQEALEAYRQEKDEYDRLARLRREVLRRLTKDEIEALRELGV